MNHADLVNAALAFHAPLLVGAATAYQKYGDRSELFARSLQGINSVLAEMKKRIAGELSSKLRPLLERNMRDPSLVAVGGEGAEYVENITNPLAGERYLECIRDYVQSSGGAMSDYSNLLEARAAWCAWAQRLSWSLLILIIASACGCLFVLLEKLFDMNFQGWVFKASSVLSLVILASTFFCLVLKLRHHDRVMGHREQYDAN